MFKSLGMVSALLAGSDLACAGGHKPPPVTLTITIETSGQGMAPQQAIPVTLPASGQTIFVRAIPEITEKNLIKVELRPDGTPLLTFDHQGRINLDVSTGVNQGRFLVVLIDGVVVYAPIIDLQIKTGQLLIPHPLPLPIMDALQKVAIYNSHEDKGSVVQEQQQQ